MPENVKVTPPLRYHISVEATSAQEHRNFLGCTPKPKITMRNAKRRLEWCEVPPLNSGAVESDEPCFSILESDELDELVDTRSTLPPGMRSATSQVWWRGDNDGSGAGF